MTPCQTLRPPPPPNHAILILTNAFKTAIKENRIHILKGLSKQFLHQVDTNLEFFMYDHSDLEACYQLNSTPTPPSLMIPPPSLSTINNLVPVSNLLSLIHLPGAANLQTSTPWLSTILNKFNLTQAEDNVKVAPTQNAIPLAKRGPFINIIDWPTLKVKLIEEFRSRYFREKRKSKMQPLPLLRVSPDLSPKIKTLQANLEIMQNFQQRRSPQRCPRPASGTKHHEEPAFRGETIFQRSFSKLHKQCPANVQPPATFRFLAQFVEELGKNYLSTPYLYDLDLSPLSVGVNVVRQGTSKPNPQPPRFSGPQPQHPPRPCAMFSIKGFEANHYSLTSACGTGKLSSPEILKLIADNGLCFTCTQAHSVGYKCKTTYNSGVSKSVSQGLPRKRNSCT